jgi:hypothetical protein
MWQSDSYNLLSINDSNLGLNYFLKFWVITIAHRPVTIPVPLEGNMQQVPGTPNRSPQRDLDTASTAPQLSEYREIRRDPTFVPADTPVTRREIGTTRSHLTITILQLRLYALEGI